MQRKPALREKIPGGPRKCEIEIRDGSVRARDEPAYAVFRCADWATYKVL